MNHSTCNADAPVAVREGRLLPKLPNFRTELTAAQPQHRAVGSPLNAAILTASISRNSGGVLEATRRLAQSLRSSRLQPSVVGLEDEFSAQDALLWDPVPLHVCAIRGPRALGYAPGVVPALEEINPDLLHQHGLWMYPSVAASEWARRHHRPHLISAHGMLDAWALRNSRWKKRLAAALYENTNLRTAACLHALCEAEAMAYRAYGLKNPICIIPNGIDIPTTLSHAVPPWAGEIEAGQRILLYLGRLHPKKNLSRLIAAWKQCSASGASRLSEWTMVVAGWDQAGHDAELKGLARSHGLKVHFTGPLFAERKAAAFGHCDAFILPSLSEGLPMVVLEAWAYGKPVLMTSHCNLPEGFRSRAAFRIESDVEGLARGLDQVLSLSLDELRAAGRRGYDLVSQRFAWHRVSGKMESVYEWLVGGGIKPDCIWGG